MVLKWIYAGVVIAATLVLTLALRDGAQPKRAHPAGAARPETPAPAHRVDLAQPERGDAVARSEPVATRAPIEDAGPDTAAESALQTQPGTAADPISPPTAPIARRIASRLTGAGGGASGGTRTQSAAEATPPALRVRIQSGEPLAPAPLVAPASESTPGTVAETPLSPAGPPLPDLEGTPPDQRDDVLRLLEQQAQERIRTATGLVGAAPRQP